uniref:Uncharacterized protein n=1 Tax=Melopsittacus undulatus TaxID=13146 RepID=A0A8C6JT96_MELUD
MIVVLTATVQLCGINAIYFYTFEVLQTAGFDERMISYMTLSVGLSELIATAVCSSIIERLGRKVLLRGGYFIMGSLLAAITVTLSLQVRKLFSYLCLIILFAIVFGVGPGKTQIQTLCKESENLKHFCFLIFMVVIFTSATIIHLFLPETKGKSIMEITEEFDQLNFRKKYIPTTPSHGIPVIPSLSL